MMKTYEKPIALTAEDTVEGIYLASGDGTDSGNQAGNTEGEKVCRFGRKYVKTNASDCKKCVASGGVTVSNDHSSDLPPGHMTITAEDCPDKMPEKNK